MESDLDFYWRQIIALDVGGRIGNERGMVFSYHEYFLVDVDQGVKRISGLDAARFLAGVYSFDEVAELDLTQPLPTYEN